MGLGDKKAKDCGSMVSVCCFGQEKYEAITGQGPRALGKLLRLKQGEELRLDVENIQKGGRRYLGET